MAERPPLADEFALLAATAEHLLAERIAKYPAMIVAQKMTQSDADTGIRTIRGVVDEWRDMLDGTPAPTPLSIVARVTRNGTRGTPEAREAGRVASSHHNTLIQRYRDDDREANRMEWPAFMILRVRQGFDLL
jgi:hypothetical protein